MALNLKDYFRESIKEYLTIIKNTMATKQELSGKNATNLNLVSYSMAAAESPVGENDTIQIAISKLEKGVEVAKTMGGDDNVQSDWAQTDTGADDYIKNKPDLSSLHTHSNMTILSAITAAFTTELKNKLDGIEANANHYVLPADVVHDSEYVHTDNNYTNGDKSKVNKLAADPNATYATQQQIDDINAILASDDTTLDELQEVVDFIKANRDDLESLTLDNIAETATKKHFTTEIKNSLAFTDITSSEAQTDWDNS